MSIIDSERESLQVNYDDMINGVFEITYEDLVASYKKRKEAQDRLEEADTYKKVENAKFDIRCAERKIEFYSDWLRDVLPKWRNIDPEKIIKRAKEVGENDDV